MSFLAVGQSLIEIAGLVKRPWNGNELITRSRCSITTWDSCRHTDATLSKVFAAHMNSILCMHVDMQRSQVITAGADNAVKVRGFIFVFVCLCHFNSRT